MEQSYKEKYEQAIERLKQWDREHPCAGYVLSDRDKFIFPELADSEDEVTRKEIINYFRCQSEEEPTRKEIHDKWIAWLENIPVIIDHEKREGFHLGYKACLERQGEQKPNGGIVREDFTQGDGWYKVNLDYLSKVQVEEIEQLVEKWNPKEVSEEEKIKKAILIYLDWLDGKKDYLPKGDYTIKDMILWLERQGEHANFLSKIQVGDKVTRNEAGVLVNLSQLKRVAKPSKKQGEQEKDILEDAILDGNEDGLIAETIRYKNEKQDEKKPACEENEPHKELAESYLAKFDEKFPILPTLKGKQLADYKNFLNKCQQIFRLKYWGIRPIQAKLFEKLSLLWAAWGAEHLQGLGQTDGDMDNEISMWSEEDSFRTETLISVIKSGGSIRPELRNEFVNWLKSLRPQSRWKPSDEQIKVCKEVYADILSAKGFDLGTVVSELNRMEEQLKKLRDE